jgi:hypothetical protein
MKGYCRGFGTEIPRVTSLSFRRPSERQFFEFRRRRWYSDRSVRLFGRWLGGRGRPPLHELLLGDGGLVAYGLPVAAAADPDSGVAVGAAEIFTELVASDVGAGGDYGSVAIDSHYHVANVDGVVAELAAFAGGEGILFRGHLAERGDGDIVFGERALGELGVAVQAGFLGLALHVDNFADGGLITSIERWPGMNGHVLAGKSR